MPSSDMGNTLNRPFHEAIALTFVLFNKDQTYINWHLTCSNNVMGVFSAHLKLMLF